MVPADGVLLSHDSRRNLTDAQETAQWLGGVAVPKTIMESLMSSLHVLICEAGLLSGVFFFERLLIDLFSSIVCQPRQCQKLARPCSGASNYV